MLWNVGGILKFVLPSRGRYTVERGGKSTESVI